jgi:hypothetical protein
MSSNSLVFSESIDDVLTAVQETPRGRWFLEAYSAKLKSDGTANILGAIAKLENNLERLSNTGANAELLEKARSAIGIAKQEISAIEPQVAKLSTEAQLFSSLAELSRKAFDSAQSTPSLGKGVARALKLVADLDRDLNPVQTKISVVPAKTPVQYFKQDEEIFEPAPAASPVAITLVKPVEPVEISTKGAKLTIRRHANETPDEPTSAKPDTSELSALSTITEPRSEPPVIKDEPSAEPITVEASRIVIIRRKAHEAVTVPLVDITISESQETVSAA